MPLILCAVAACTPPPASPPPETTGPEKKDEPAPALIVSVPELPGANCVEGGSAVHTGFDTDFSGVLEPDEYADTQYLCHGLKTLVDTERVESHADCFAGGVIVRNGLDTNGDGVLDSAEVDETQVVCDGSGGGCGENGIVHGHLTLESSLDLHVASQCLEVTGDLNITFGADQVNLPLLTRVGGSLVVTGAVGDLALEGLISVDGDLELPTPARAALPKLTQIGGGLESGVSRLTLDQLTTIGGLLRLRDRARLTLPVLAQVAAVTSDFACLLDAPALQAIEQSLSVGAWSTSLLPALSALGGPLTAGRGALVDLRSLSEVPGDLHAMTSSRLDLAALTRVDGDMRVDGETQVSADLLAEIDGDLTLGASTLSLPALNAVNDVSIQHTSSAPATLTLDSLQSLTSLRFVVGSGGAIFTAPQLTTASLLDVTDDNLRVEVPALSALTQLRLGGSQTTLTAPALTAAASVTLFPERAAPLADLESFATVTGDLLVELADTALGPPLTLPLQSVGGRLTLRGGNRVESLSFPALTQVGGEVKLSQLEGLRVFDAPLLENLGVLEADRVGRAALRLPALTATTGSVSLNAGVASVDLGQLQSVGNNLTVRNTELSDLSLPALNDVGGYVRLENNAQLGRCQLLDLQDQLTAAGFTGSFTQSGNLEDHCLATLCVINGDVLVQNSQDLEALAGCREVTGELRITASSLAGVELPFLDTVGGDLVMSVDTPTMDFSGLRNIGGELYCSVSSAVPDFSSLASVGDDFWVSGSRPATLSFPALTHVAGDIEVASGGRVSLPALEEHVGRLKLFDGAHLTMAALRSQVGALTTQYASRLFLPALETYREGIINIGQWSDTDFSELRSIGRGIAVGRGGRFYAPSLPEIPEHLAVDTDGKALVPLVTRIGTSLSVQGQTTTDFTSLVSIGSSVTIGASSVSFPALKIVGDRMWVFNHSSIRTTVDLPKLTEAAGLKYDGPIDTAAPLLASTGWLELRDGASGVFDSLVSVDGVVSLVGPRGNAAAASLPVLQSAGGIWLWGYMADFGLGMPMLQTVAENFTTHSLSGSTDGGNSTLSLPALTQVGGNLDMHEGFTGFDTALFPVLESVGGELIVERHAALTTLNMDALTSVGSEVKLRYNSQLDICQVEAITERLIALGNPGGYSTVGNLGATCE